MSRFRSSQTIQTILLHLFHTPETYGAELTRITGLTSGHLYPALARLRKHGLVTDRWEDINPTAEHRPRRRLYRLTPDGLALAREEQEKLMKLHRTLLPGVAS